MQHYNALSLAVALSFAGFTLAQAEDAPVAAPAAADSAVKTPSTDTSTPASAPAKAQATWEVKDVPATKLWVSDRLEVPLRSCPGDRCRVVKIVRPGNEMTQIGLTPDGWSLVSVGDIKGYLPKRYLQDTPVASQQLEGAQRQSIEAIQAQHGLKSELDALRKRAETAEAETGNLRKDNYEIKQELDYVKSVSTQTLMVNEENRRLKNEVEALRQKNAILEQEAEDVEGKNQRAWVMVGAGVVFLGWVLGRFARSPRRRGWNQL